MFSKVCGGPSSALESALVTLSFGPPLWFPPRLIRRGLGSRGPLRPRGRTARGEREGAGVRVGSPALKGEA